jgi:hypothetical protein
MPFIGSYTLAVAYMNISRTGSHWNTASKKQTCRTGLYWDAIRKNMCAESAYTKYSKREADVSQ